MPAALPFATSVRLQRRMSSVVARAHPEHRRIHPERSGRLEESGLKGNSGHAAGGNPGVSVLMLPG